MTSHSEHSPDDSAPTVESRLRTLFAQSALGDTLAYRCFLDELSHRLRAYFRGRLTRFPEDAEDLVQETLLAVHNQRHTYDAAQPLTPWVHAIARYKLADFLRRYRRVGALTDSFDDNEAHLDISDKATGEARRDLGRLLHGLPDKMRQPIIHMKIEGLSAQETAHLTGMSESAVKVAVHRGLKTLAATIRRHP